MNRDIARDRLRFPTKWSCGTAFPRYRGSRTVAAQTPVAQALVQPDRTAAGDVQRKGQEPNE